MTIEDLRDTEDLKTIACWDKYNKIKVCFASYASKLKTLISELETLDPWTSNSSADEKKEIANYKSRCELIE